MTNFLDKKFFCVVIFILCINLYSNGQEIAIPKKNNLVDSIVGKTIISILESNLFGDIIDIYFPTKLINCYLVVFKKDDIVYQIAANTKNRVSYAKFDKMDLNNLIAIGYYAINYPDGRKKHMFKRGEGTPFDFLNDIDIDNYITIYDIEKKCNIVFTYVERGGFLSPFFDYYCDVGDGQIIYVMGSPSDDKKTSYFMGGWAFSKEKSKAGTYR